MVAVQRTLFATFFCKFARKIITLFALLSTMFYLLVSGQQHDAEKHSKMKVKAPKLVDFNVPTTVHVEAKIAKFLASFPNTVCFVFLLKFSQFCFFLDVIIRPSEGG